MIKGVVPHTGLFLLPATLALEVSVGKAATIYAVNGTEVLLPCTFSSCFGFHNLAFSWSYNSSDAFRVVSSRGGGSGGDGPGQTASRLSLSPAPTPDSGPWRLAPVRAPSLASPVLFAESA